MVRIRSAQEDRTGAISCVSGPPHCIERLQLYSAQAGLVFRRVDPKLFPTEAFRRT